MNTILITGCSSGFGLETARDGVGIWHGVESVVASDLAAGRLVRMLEEWSPTYPGSFLYHPAGAPVPSGLQALIDLIRFPRDRTSA